MNVIGNNLLLYTKIAFPVLFTLTNMIAFAYNPFVFLPYMKNTNNNRDFFNLLIIILIINNYFESGVFFLENLPS